MFRKPEDAIKQVRTMNCLLSGNGVGDQLASLVAVDYLIRNTPYVNLLIWTPDYLVDFARNVLSDGACVRSYTEAKKKFDDSRPGIQSSDPKGRFTPARMHPVDYGFHSLADMHMYDMTKKNYLKLREPVSLNKFCLPTETRHVVIQAYAAEKVKRMPASLINAIAEYVVKLGYMPIFVGKESNETGYKTSHGSKARAEPGINFDLGIDLTNKTSLSELAQIMQNSACFIGMDGGILHLAGFTDVPIIAGYTFIDWKHNAPIRNDTVGHNCYIVEPDESLGCKGCQSNWSLWSRDYRVCHYGDYACVGELTFEKFKDKIDLVLKNGE